MLSVFDAKSLADFATAIMFQKAKTQILAHPTLYPEVDRLYVKVCDEILAAAGTGDYELNTSVFGLYIRRQCNPYSTTTVEPSLEMENIRVRLEQAGFKVRYENYVTDKCDEDHMFFGLVISWSI